MYVYSTIPVSYHKKNKQCLLDTPCTVMVNKENCYGEYKGHTKRLSLISSHFAKNIFFFAWHVFMHMPIISVLYLQSTVKREIFVEFCSHYQSAKIKIHKIFSYFWKISVEKLVGIWSQFVVVTYLPAVRPIIFNYLKTICHYKPFD